MMTLAATTGGSRCVQASQSGLGPRVAPSALAGRYVLSFSDEFNDGDVGRFNETAIGGRPGAPAWRTRYWFSRNEVINGEKQIYVDAGFAGTAERPLGLQPFSIRSGILTIAGERADPQMVDSHLTGRRYTSGVLTSELTHWQTYGYFEMRARLPSGRGFWPAFWLLPKRNTQPPEIDVFEGSGERPDEVHVGVIEEGPKRRGASGWFRMPRSLAADRMRVFAMEWTPQHIRFFVDGQALHTVAPHSIHEDMYLLTNLAIGSHDSTWIRDPDASTPFPGRFDIDYIRAFRRA